MNWTELENRFLEYGIYRKGGWVVYYDRERERCYSLYIYKNGCLPLLLLYVIIGESSTEE